MIKHTILLIKTIIVAFFITSCSSAQKNLNVKSNGNRAFIEENNSRFSLRNIQSGQVIINISDQQGRELVGWELFSVSVPDREASKYPGGWVEFSVPSSDRCLALVNSTTLDKAPCGASGNITVFTLIPSTTGAVQIKSVGFGTCIQDVDLGTDHFTMGRCIEDVSNPTETVPERSLWMLNPPSNESPLTPF